MTMHSKPVEGTFKPDWEHLGQIDPTQIPLPSETYPGPWKTSWRGNGHVDLIDAQGRYFAHVYCWDKAESDLLDVAVKASKNWVAT